MCCRGQIALGWRSAIRLGTLKIRVSASYIGIFLLKEE